MLVLFLLFCAVSTVWSGSGTNMMVDYIIGKVDSDIQRFGDDPLDLSGFGLNLPSGVSNPRFFGLSTLHRLSDVMMSHDNRSASIGFNTGFVDIGLECSIHKFLSGALKTHMTAAQLNVIIDLKFDDTKCTMSVRVGVTLDDFYVDVWGLTQIGDDVVKEKIREYYSSHQDDWIYLIREKITSAFTQIPQNPLCNTVGYFIKLNNSNITLDDVWEYQLAQMGSSTNN